MIKRMERSVYILRLKNNQYYIGSTNNIERRFAEHQIGHTATTKRIPVIEILYHRKYATKEEARKIEMFLKKQKSRVLIEKFMTNAWKDS